MTLYFDLGHGGDDPGATVEHTTERDELRNVCGDRLRSYFHSLGIIIVPAHDLRERVAWIAKRSTFSDRVVSIHLNAGPAAASGTEVYYFGDRGVVSGVDATALSRHYALSIGLQNRGAKLDTQSARGRLSICRDCGCPGYLLEAAFLTNADDLRAFQARGDYAIVSALAALRWV